MKLVLLSLCYALARSQYHACATLLVATISEIFFFFFFFFTAKEILLLFDCNYTTLPALPTMLKYKYKYNILEIKK